MLVTQRALQRQPVARPLILHVEGVVARAVGLLPRRDALRDLIGHARAMEAVLQTMRREVAEDVGHFVGRLVAHLHAVRAGDVGQRPRATRCASGGCCSARRSRGRPCWARAPARRPDSACSCTGMNGAWSSAPAGAGRVPVAEELREGRFEQQLVGHRRRVRELHDVSRSRRASVRGLRRPRAEPVHRQSSRHRASRHCSASCAYELPSQTI